MSKHILVMNITRHARFEVHSSVSVGLGVVGCDTVFAD
jgi:hypothetical protein